MSWSCSAIGIQYPTRAGRRVLHEPPAGADPLRRGRGRRAGRGARDGGGAPPVRAPRPRRGGPPRGRRRTVRSSRRAPYPGADRADVRRGGPHGRGVGRGGGRRRGGHRRRLHDGHGQGRAPRPRPGAAVRALRCRGGGARRPGRSPRDRADDRGDGVRGQWRGRGRRPGVAPQARCGLAAHAGPARPGRSRPDLGSPAWPDHRGRHRRPGPGHRGDRRPRSHSGRGRGRRRGRPPGRRCPARPCRRPVAPGPRGPLADGLCQPHGRAGHEHLRVWGGAFAGPRPRRPLRPAARPDGRAGPGRGHGP